MTEGRCELVCVNMGPKPIPKPLQWCISASTLGHKLAVSEGGGSHYPRHLDNAPAAARSGAPKSSPSGFPYFSTRTTRATWTTHALRPQVERQKSVPRLNTRVGYL